MNKKQKIIFPVIIVGFLVLFFIGYYYLVGFNNWAGATWYSFSFFSILNKKYLKESKSTGLSKALGIITNRMIKVNVIQQIITCKSCILSVKYLTL